MEKKNQLPEDEELLDLFTKQEVYYLKLMIEEIQSIQSMFGFDEIEDVESIKILISNFIARHSIEKGNQ